MVISPVDLERERKWYAVYTYPNAEKKLHERLLEKGLESYLPVKSELRVWSDRRKIISEPLFKSYLFVKIDNVSFDRVLSTKGSAHFVSFSGKPATIPEKQINAIKTVISDYKGYELRSKRYRKGELVEVLSGALSGYRGTLLAEKGKNKLAIEIKHLGYSLLVELDRNSVFKVNMN